MLKDYRSNRMLYWLLLPALLYVIIFNYVPMFGLVIAFEDYSIFGGIFNSRWVGLDNFKEFFSSMYFGRTLKNTLSISLMDLMFNFPAPIIFALMLNEVRRPKYKKLLQTVSYMPHFISMVVVAGLIKEFTSSTGPLAQIVVAFGGRATSYLSQAHCFRPIFVISEIWQSIGFNSIIYLAALSGISEDQYEAAQIDGAGKWRQLLHVTLPGLAPTIIIMLILRCGAIMNVNFEKVLLLYSPATYKTSDIISTYVYRVGIEKQQLGYSTAVGLFNSVVSLLLVLTANKLSKTFTETSMF